MPHILSLLGIKPAKYVIHFCINIKMTVMTDRLGHNYYGPLFFMIGLTIAIFGAILLVCVFVWVDRQIESLLSLCRKKDDSLIQTPKSSRVTSVDVFRGIDLCCMIFANYGAGQYHRALVHATWDGITFSDFAFPMYLCEKCVI